jgi:hypothetical protein
MKKVLTLALAILV